MTIINEERVTWWIKHKNKVYGLLLMIVGAFGGNVDRFSDLLPTSPTVQNKLDAHGNTLDNHEERIKVLEAKGADRGPTPVLQSVKKTKEQQDKPRKSIIPIQ